MQQRRSTLHFYSTHVFFTMRNAGQDYFIRLFNAVLEREGSFRHTEYSLGS
jgi:hypothetical protein